MAIDSHYIAAFSIETVILDKDTGAPLTGGLVYFEQDNQRGVLKPVFQITGNSPDYTYTQLPNPMTLSSIGTFEDALSNPVVPYFFPYDGDNNPEYYYVRVTSSDGVEQFTREAVPYIAIQGSSEILSVISNEISNPQFAEISFDISNGAYTYSLNAATDQVINIAPDWDLVVTCPTTGSVTVNILTPAGTLNLVTNPGTILNISSAGVTKLQLRQRIFGSPNLWGDGYLSASFVAKTYSGSGDVLNLSYAQSNGGVNSVIISATLNASGAYGQFSGSVNIPQSGSIDQFPDAYIDIFFDIPLNVEIDITSVMIASTGETSVPNIDYDQESYDRQIDHLYHAAYPIVPVGTIIDFGGFEVPEHYLLCNGQTKNRIEFNELFQALTKTESVTLTLGVATFTVADSTFYRIGMPIEGVGVSVGVTVSNIVGNTITMSAVAVAPAGVQTVRFFASGNGDGSTTFDIYDLRNLVTAGAGGTGLVSLANSGIGGVTGQATHAITIPEMPTHNHPGSTALIFGTGGGGTFATPANVTSAGTTALSIANEGNGTPMTIVQPTAFFNKCIRFE